MNKTWLLSKLKFSLGIRSKILISASFLLAIPYMSYQYVWELENFLREGQEQTLVGTARAVATVLHERPSLFDHQAALLTDITPGTDLYAHKIDFPIKLDGMLSDWLSYQEYMISYGAKNLVEQNTVYNQSSITFEHMVGKYERYLYAMFKVTDDSVVMREKNSFRIDRNDSVQIALINSIGKFERYIVAPYESGWVNAYKLEDTRNALTPINLETRIQGHWETTQNGYNLELRFPLSMLSNKIAFAVIDVDDLESREIKYKLGTADPSRSDDLGTILFPSPEIERIIRGLAYSQSRIWVLDRHMRVLAKSGDIVDTDLLHQNINTKKKDHTSYSDDTLQIIHDKGLWAWIENKVLLPLYYQFLTKPPEDFIDDLSNAYALEGSDIEQAMQGSPSTLWRLSSDNKAVILSAAHPIYMDNQVMGAVVVEQTTHGIRTLRNEALEKQFHLILTILLVASISLFALSSSITSRIRRLRDDTDNAIDANGKIVSLNSPSKTHDEIGDLSRSFHQVLTKLSQYNHYLENMASRLSHELRTPVAVVNSSLDNLSDSASDEEKQQYISRAKDGINRLSKILNSMSEATRLEQAINDNEPEQFDLTQILPIWIESYNHTFADANLMLDMQMSIANLIGSPEMLAQMLDKIVTNAREFKHEDTSIRIRLFENNAKITLSISNQGPLLPDNATENLLNSMISVRASTSSEQSHLGLGLFVANIIARYHKGNLSIHNLPDHTGVIALVEFEK